MKKIKPIYIITILLVPIELDTVIGGLIEGKAYLKHMIIGGKLGTLINIILLIICIYLFHKFCEVYKEIYKIKLIIKSYMKIIVSPFGIFLILMLLYDLHFIKYINDKTIGILVTIFLIIMTYLMLIIKLKKLIKKYINE